MLKYKIQSKYKRANGDVYVIDNFWWGKGDITHVDLIDLKGKKYPMIELKWLDEKVYSGELERVK